MPQPGFVHLHCHTHYSLLDGANKIPELVKRVKSLGMDSIAITDHGCMFGVIEFYNECKKEGIKPIIGMEAYVAPGDRREKSIPSGNAGDAAYHLLLLAENLEGYKNLIKLSTTAYRDGFYYKPRIDKEILRELRHGLFATSACLGGEIPSAYLKRDARSARKIAETYVDIFGPERFFIEVQKQGLADQDAVNPELEELANKLGVGLVATNDVHFLTKEDHFAHDVLCCISMGRLVKDDNRLKYPEQLYLKSPAEMIQALGHFNGAIDNTLRIAQSCNLELDFSKRHAPVYKVEKEKLAPAPAPAPAPESSPPQPDDERYLRQLCEQGLLWRYNTKDVSPAIRTRLDYELKIIASKNFCSYFLIVWDFCNYARENDIPVGARGSGVGTMVGYLLGLCNVDPIRYGLLFERFMDPSRNELPDIDIDICQEGRGKIIDYVRNKYGHVAQIITFGTLAARAVCKDVGRVLGVPLPEIDKLTKLIPGTPGMTLERALNIPELAEIYKSNPAIAQVIDVGRRLEGTCRNAGCHAAGVVIADQPLENFLPLYRTGEDLLTQFEGPIVEKVGLLKMDFLGLRTLTTLQRAVHLEKQTRELRGAEKSDAPKLPDGRIDVEKIDFADPKVLALFQRGETKGIFQFESGGMQDLLMKMQPDRIEDLIAANALYRPGPMELIPSYCNRKHGREPVPKVHPIMDAILAETYGIMCYQEQVMQVFNQLGGIELSNAYKLIKAISKKAADVIAKFKPDFLIGATQKGVDKSKAEEIFELILKFGGYGFNKSHSTRYAIIAFQTAYLKTYHPVEYVAAVLTFEMGNTDKVVEYIEECRRLTLPDGSKGVGVLPPDVNFSDKDFTPVYVSDAPKPKRKRAPQPRGEIRFGLMAVRGVGEKAVEAVMTERKNHGPFNSLYDFCERVDLRTVTRSTIEAFVKCGAFASTSARRSQLLQVLEKSIENGQQSQADKRMGQMGMFAQPESKGASLPSAPLPNLPELDAAELLSFEKELLGFYVTSHPLTTHQLTLERFATSSTKDLHTMSENSEVTFGGMVTRVKKSLTKNGRSAGQQMAMITIEDLDGQIDGVVFAETYAEINAKYPGALANEAIVFVKGRLDRRRETPSIVVSEIIPVKDAASRLATSLVIKLDGATHRVDVLSDMKAVLEKHKGNLPVFAQAAGAIPGEAAVVLLRQFPVRATQLLLGDLDQILGHGASNFHGQGSKRRRKLEQEKLFKNDTEEKSPQPLPEEIPDELPEQDLELAASIEES